MDVCVGKMQGRAGDETGGNTERERDREEAVKRGGRSGEKSLYSERESGEGESMQ